MGPTEGACEVLPSGATTSALFAALINGAASHVVEQDDVHNGSVFHPATVIFPAVVAVAQAEGKSGRDVLVATVAGYEVGIRVGEFLGRSHYKIFHTTGTAGTIASAVAVAKLLGLDADATQHAMGSAGTQAAGLWEFLRDGADSKQLHTAKAAADGLLAAYLAREGVTGRERILEGSQGMAAGMSTDADPSRSSPRAWARGGRHQRLHTSGMRRAGTRIRRPTHCSRSWRASRLTHDQIAGVTARVHRGAIDVLGQVTNPQNIHQAKFSMGTVLGLIAVHGDARLDEFEQHAFGDPRVAAFRERVQMVLDAEVDYAVSAPVDRKSGRGDDRRPHVHGARRRPQGRSGQRALTRRARGQGGRLGQFRGAATDAEVRSAIDRIWELDSADRVGRLVR